MRRERRASGFIIVWIAFTASLLLSCEKPSDQTKTSELEPRVESNATPTPQTSQFLQPIPSPSPTAPPAPPPKLDEVRSAMARVFANVAAPETTNSPAFVVGDFNGDGSQDLAVITTANAGSLKEINNELANWVLEDPRSVPIPGANPTNPMSAKPIRAEKGDTLLAIIHGVGAKGWRNPAAKQTFLLKNAAGSNMTVLAVKDLLASKDKARLPPLRGDAISETVGGKAGLLFWTGAKYAWHPSSE